MDFSLYQETIDTNPTLFTFLHFSLNKLMQRLNPMIPRMKEILPTQLFPYLHNYNYSQIAKIYIRITLYYSNSISRLRQALHLETIVYIYIYIRHPDEFHLLDRMRDISAPLFAFTSLKTT